ncbi:MAG TPA: ATP-binding cassette domain-containing protein [Anaerolineae bacterium]|nr:ATP-binding cassette domain-containing protein [Anaerolineae bacterium]
MEPLLRAVNLSKTLGTLTAVRRVSLEIYPGEVVGLAGQSGAGKSALAMMLAGIYTPSEGEIYLDGERLRPPFRGRSLGIEVIHQQPEMAETLDIGANVFLGNELGWPPAGRWLKVPNRRRMDREAAHLLAQLDMQYDSLRDSVGNLSSEQRQLIAIARAMTRPARLILVDDPTLPLSFGSQQRLLALIRDWQQAGTAVLLASDDVDDLMAVTDRIVVLRHGRCVATLPTDGTGREEVLSAMVGIADRQQLTPILWALDSYYRAREQAEKLHQRQAMIERDLGARNTVSRQLIDNMVDQIDALDSANVALQDAQRRLLAELELERKQLAREIHDQVIQDMLGVNYQIEEMEAEAAVTPGLQAGLAAVRASIRDLVDDLRHICGSLRPPTIDSLGLGPALQSYTRDWSERAGIAASLHLDPQLRRLPEAIELSLFRIVQEGLNNVRKHAEACRVEVRLEHTSPRALMLSIGDDGCGLAENFDLAALSAEGHYGLLGVSERVALLGGRCKVGNRPGGGTLLQVEIPHPRVEQGKQAE